jgi:peptidyl-prolyl cis-trans isomerase SurA
MKKLSVISIFVLVSALILSNCSTPNENAVVTIEDRVISIDNVRDILKARYPNSENYNDIDLQVKKDLLEPLIKKNLKIYAAYDMGLDEDESFQKKLKDQKMRILGSKYYETIIIDPLVPERSIENFLSRMGTEVKASHILIGYEGARRPAQRSKDEALKLVNDIIDELNRGADFATTAVKYSEDKSAKRNEGNLGYFTWGRMVGPFQETAWGLDIGEISGPVETMFGYHIIKVFDRREVPNYKPDRSPRNILRIKQTLAKEHVDSARVHWLKHFAGLKKKYNYVLYEDSIKYVSKMLSEKKDVEKIIPGSFTSAQREITFAEYKGDKINLGYLIEKYKNNLAKTFNRFTDDRVLKQEIDRDSMNRLVMLDAADLGIDKQPDIVKEIKKFSDEQMSRMIENEQTTDPINPTDEEIRTYYDNNKESFMKGAEIEIWEIYMTDENLAKAVVNKAKSGVDFQSLVNGYSEDTNLKQKGGYLGYKAINQRGIVSREAHKLGPGGKIGGPVKYRRGWAVFKTGKKNEPRQLSFEEVKDQAKNKLTRELTTKAKSEWEANLREKYSVNIDEEKLKEI